jgi:prophage regulatory protein
MRLLIFPQLKTEKGVPYTNEHLARLEKREEFPRRVPIGAARVAWLEEEVDAWIAKRAARRTPVTANAAPLSGCTVTLPSEQIAKRCATAP